MFYLSESFLIDACKYLLSQSCTFSQFIIYNGVWCYKNAMCIYFECRTDDCVAPGAQCNPKNERTKEDRREFSSVAYKSVDSKCLRFFSRCLWCTADIYFKHHPNLIANKWSIRWQLLLHIISHQFLLLLSSESNPYYFFLSIAFSCLFAQNVTIFDTACVHPYIS